MSGKSIFGENKAFSNYGAFSTPCPLYARKQKDKKVKEQKEGKTEEDAEKEV